MNDYIKKKETEEEGPGADRQLQEMGWEACANACLFINTTWSGGTDMIMCHMTTYCI